MHIDTWKDEDYPDFTSFSITTPTAKKEHICDLCGKVIETGAKYNRNVYLLDGKLVMNKYHEKLCIEVEK